MTGAVICNIVFSWSGNVNCYLKGIVIMTRFETGTTGRTAGIGCYQMLFIT